MDRVPSSLMASVSSGMAEPSMPTPHSQAVSHFCWLSVNRSTSRTTTVVPARMTSGAMACQSSVGLTHSVAARMAAVTSGPQCDERLDHGADGRIGHPEDEVGVDAEQQDAHDHRHPGDV